MPTGCRGSRRSAHGSAPAKPPARAASSPASALKRSYRDLLRAGHPDVRFVCLVGSHELLLSRLTSRTGHFMPASLLDSQLATFEPLQPDEPGVTIDVSAPQAQIEQAAVAALTAPAPPRGDQPTV